jgi:hypothetical protein
MLTERDRMLLNGWNAGYDAGYFLIDPPPSLSVATLHERGAWVAGYIRGLRDRKGQDDPAPE